jgi:hypothetical protein
VCGFLWVATQSQSLFHAGLVYSAARVSILVVHWAALLRSVRADQDPVVVPDEWARGAAGS